jgi:hypothetical protein
MRTLVATFALVALIAAAVTTADAQITPPAARAWLIITDNGAGRDTIWFGHDATATYGLDTPLGEFELPPPPPAGVFEVRFQNKPGREGTEPPAGMGQGFAEDYRPSTQVQDTHRVRLQPGEGGFPMTITWDPASVLLMCDSAWIQDEFGGILLKRRLHVDPNAVVTNSALNTLILIRFGARGGSSVDPIDNVVPGEFGLFQNYPNPFNPSTTVRFAVARLAKTDVAVYDVLGKRVATVVAEQLAPGNYEVVWNGTNDLGTQVASGVYMLRMTAVDEQGAGFSSLRKIVLMK